MITPMRQGSINCVNWTTAPTAMTRQECSGVGVSTASNKANFGEDVLEHNDGTLNAAGKRVVVIGGGDTAGSCAHSAASRGRKVTVMYRRDRDNMPDHSEVQNAEEEGAVFEWLSAHWFVSDNNVTDFANPGATGKVTALSRSVCALGRPMPVVAHPKEQAANF